MTQHRSKSPYGTREKIARVAWALVQATAFRCSFHTWYRWRAFVLRWFGASIHPSARIRRTVRIECPWNLSIGDDSAVGDHVTLYCLGKIAIGTRVSVSQGAHLCAGTHDYRDRSMPLRRLPIVVGDDAWICADAFVGPGVVIGTGAILGARGVALTALGEWSIYLGNPAAWIKARPRFADDLHEPPRITS